MIFKAWNSGKTSPLALALALLAPAVLGARGCDVAVVGSECGGLQGEQCGANLFCDFALDAICGAADQTGTCRRKPEACTAIFDPVCGCDGQTYGNSCDANRAGVSVASNDACPVETPPTGAVCGGLLGLGCGPDDFCNFPIETRCGSGDQTGICTTPLDVCADIFKPVCGCDDKTYGNACEANGAGVSVASEGACATEPGPKICGGLTGGEPCADGEFCKFAVGDFCGAADATGTCTPIPTACTRIFAPVCGCDGNTYSNECEANTKGVSAASSGACGGTEPPGKDCGGLLGLQCDSGEFCKFALGDFCGAADATGICSTPTEVCADIFAPVCGCDGKTYGNECEANAAGTSAASSGECATEPGAVCGGFRGQTCAADQFCSFTPDAICGFADATGVCVPRPEACIQIFAPVCGCDGQTYGSTCQANSAGTSVQARGECPTP